MRRRFSLFSYSAAWQKLAAGVLIAVLVFVALNSAVAEVVTVRFGPYEDSFDVIKELKPQYDQDIQTHSFNDKSSLLARYTLRCASTKKISVFIDYYVKLDGVLVLLECSENGKPRIRSLTPDDSLAAGENGQKLVLSFNYFAETMLGLDDFECVVDNVEGRTRSDICLSCLKQLEGPILKKYGSWQGFLEEMCQQLRIKLLQESERKKSEVK